MKTLTQILNESLEIRSIKYKGTRKNYQIHDPNPNIIVLDPHYSRKAKNRKGSGILAFNLNYLDTELSKKEKKKLIKDIQKLDDKIVNIKKVKSFIRRILNSNVGDYENLSAKTKKERYYQLVTAFPVLKKIIRHYKRKGIV